MAGRSVDMSWVKYLIYAVIAMMVLPFIMSMLTGMTKMMSAFAGTSPPSPEEAKKLADNDQTLKTVDNSVNKSKLTRTSAEYAAIANKLYEAMDHSGTDVGTMMAALRGLNNDELLQVISEYGIRTTHVFFFDDVTGTLMDHFNSELSGSDLEAMQKVFAGTGVRI